MDISKVNVPMVNKKGELTSHTKIIESTLGSMTLSREPQDMITPVLNLDTDFSVEIPTRADFNKTGKTLIKIWQKLALIFQ